MHGKQQSQIIAIITIFSLIFIHINYLHAFTRPQPIIKPVLSDLKPNSPENQLSTSKDSTTVPVTNASPAEIIIKQIRAESITLTYSDEFIVTEKPDNKDEEFLKDLITFTEKTIPNQVIVDEENYSGQKMVFYVLPRTRYIKYQWGRLKDWFSVKDKNYHSDSKRGKLRKEWETLIGIDVFHPYYKWKEARRAFKKRCSFNTSSILPGIPKMRVTPEYKSKKLFITVSRKF